MIFRSALVIIFCREAINYILVRVVLQSAQFQTLVFLFVTRRSVVKLFDVLEFLGKWEIAIYDFRISSYMWSAFLCQSVRLAH